MARRNNIRRLLGGTVSFLILAAVLALFFAYRKHSLQFHPPHLSISARQLPYYAFCSFYRMLAAYALALLFSIVYGLTAARGRIYERILIPAIDVAQSVPVIGFFPAAIYFFVSLAHGRLGVELAAIFLIFTSQAWNMALGVFEAAKTIPGDSTEALESFGVSGWLKFKRLLLPACVPKLVYNSILSWVAGWYFLIACEIITVGPANYRLPGLGSYLMEAADRGEPGQLIAGLLTLLAIIIAIDLFIWQPLSVWSEKFRYEFAASSPQMQTMLGSSATAWISPVLSAAVWILGLPLRLGSWILRLISGAMPTVGRETRESAARVLRWMLIAGGIALACGLAYSILRGIVALIEALVQPWPAEAWLIPKATLFSTLRMITAYAISLAWIIPCALLASDNPRLHQRLASVAQIVGSVPATALFPLIVVFVIRVTGGMNLASVLLILTGMQWYLLFNLLAGVTQIPEDLKEAVRSFGLSRVAGWRRLVLPALMPSLITGSITAWGGGWNALILSEYFLYRGHTYQVLGLGALLDAATYGSGNSVMMLLSLLSMVLVVILLNRLVWRRLYDVVTERYRLDY
jgi:NitT/TauT family transport system permease protein